MKLPQLLLALVLGWTLLGIAGIALRLSRGERATPRRHILWIAIVWLLYFAALFGSSLLLPQRVFPLGHDQCDGSLCFAVIGSEEINGFGGRDHPAGEVRLLRVKIRITNTSGSSDADRRIEAYLLDAKGRRWNAIPGLSGNRLDATVAAHRSIVSEPVFRVPLDASGFRLVFTHGRGLWQLFTIGGSDSFLHRPDIVVLNR